MVTKCFTKTRHRRAPVPPQTLQKGTSHGPWPKVEQSRHVFY